MAFLIEIILSIFLEFFVYVILYVTGAVVIRLFSLNKLKPPLSYDKDMPSGLDSFDWFSVCVVIGVFTWFFGVLIIWGTINWN